MDRRRLTNHDLRSSDHLLMLIELTCLTKTLPSLIWRRLHSHLSRTLLSIDPEIIPRFVSCIPDAYLHKIKILLRPISSDRQGFKVEEEKEDNGNSYCSHNMCRGFLWRLYHLEPTAHIHRNTASPQTLWRVRLNREGNYQGSPTIKIGYASYLVRRN